MQRLKKLQTKIMMPFIILFLVLNLISLLLDRHYIGRLIDERISKQTDRISQALSNTEFVLNPAYLSKLREVIDGDVIVFNNAGAIAATTLSETESANFSIRIDKQQLWAGLQTGERGAVRQVITGSSGSSLVTARLLHIAAQPDKKMILCILSPLADVIAAKRTLTVRMMLVGFSGLLLTVFFSYFISRSMTKPVNQLVAVTGKIADGDFKQKAELPSVEELKMLASSINTMTDKLAEYEKQLVRSSRLSAAGKVTAAMAHEIRNPLSSIKMMTQLLRDRSQPQSENKRIAESLLEEIIRLERIVTDQTAMIRQDDFVLEVRNIADIIDEILPIIEPKLNHRNIRLISTIERSLPQIAVDKNKIKQVIWNLLLNAMESMPSGGTLSIRNQADPANNRLLIIIEDDGCGIDESNLETLFAPFYTSKPEGLGLGLSTSRDIIANHQGRLNLENRNGPGTRAVISLPIK